ncbi:unnamed protein product [Merluccius merluccius]
MALVGDDVTLSYDTKRLTDISMETVEWTRTNLNPDIVHLRENRQTLYKQQNPVYRERTVLSAEDLERGIISLRLSRIRLADEGNYTCVFSSIQNQFTIQLLIGAAAPPVVTLEEVNSSGLVLSCRSAGWFPRPQLSWWHAEGAPLPAVTIATTQVPDRLYNIDSTVVVERSLSGHFTCRVHQEHFNQTREMEIHLPKNLSNCSVQQYRYIPVVLVVVLVVLVALVREVNKYTKVLLNFTQSLESVLQ